MEALEDLAISDPTRVEILKKAAVTKLLKDGEAVIGVEYTFNGETRKAYGPVILATGECRTPMYRIVTEATKQVDTLPTSPRTDSCKSSVPISCTSLPPTETTGELHRTCVS
jgi:hypothetical protein